MKNLLKVTRIDVHRSDQFNLKVRHLRVEGGKILGIVGPNGSGKTTLIECLAGIIVEPANQIFINQENINGNTRVIKEMIGFIPDDEAWLIKELCAVEYFDLLIDIYHKLGVHTDTMRYRVRHLSKTLYFSDDRIPLGALSHGNKKKVQIIAGLLHQPKFVIIDELRNGLDPLSILAAEQIIHDEANRGACILAATHDLWWTERIADDVLVLINGSVAIHKSIATLLKTYGTLEKLFVELVKTKSEAIKHATL